MSVCIRKALLPAIFTKVFMIFLCLEENAEIVANMKVATACFSCSSPDIN
jgi:hypothetical protein